MTCQIPISTPLKESSLPPQMESSYNHIRTSTITPSIEPLSMPTLKPSLYRRQTPFLCPQHFSILFEFEQQRKLMRYKGHAFSDLLRSQQATCNEQQIDHIDNAEKWLG